MVAHDAYLHELDQVCVGLPLVPWSRIVAFDLDEEHTVRVLSEVAVDHRHPVVRVRRGAARNRGAVAANTSVDPHRIKSSFLAV
jgi:hypothetical protein